MKQAIQEIIRVVHHNLQRELQCTASTLQKAEEYHNILEEQADYIHKQAPDDPRYEQQLRLLNQYQDIVDTLNELQRKLTAATLHTQFILDIK